MSNTKVFILDGGSLVIDGFHVYWNKGPGGEVRFPVYSVLIDHADGLYLFDSGFDYDHVMAVLPFEKPQQTREQNLLGAIEKAGYRAEDINYVINSHYHFDHCGGNKHLKEACTVCHANEFGQCKCPQPFEVLGYSDMTFHPDMQREKLRREGKEIPVSPDSDIWTPKVELLTGNQEIAKGLHLIETPGHTAGHYSLLIELANRRPMLFTADACYTRKGFDEELIPSFHLDPVKAVQSVRRLKDVALKTNAEVFVSHDLEQFGQYKKAPAYYE
jgi:4-pyridoxolactonase